MSKGIPLSVPTLNGNELKYVAECIKSNWVSTAGEFVSRFESGIASYTGAAHAVATCSGTAALHTALRVLDVGEGCEVIVPTLTFIAPVNAVRYSGAEPVFMDCDEHLNIDPVKFMEFCSEECTFDGKRLVNKQSGAHVMAIVAVHIFGHPANIEPIIETARKYNILVIEDAAEALGSRYTSGRYAGKHTGTIGDIGCFSFNGNKIITTGGGGMLVTGDGSLARHAKYLTTQAKDDELYYVHNEIGYNYRMTSVEAAIGVAQLERLDEFVETKRRNFLLYEEALRGIRGLSLINEPEYGRSNYWLYSLVLDGFGLSRDELLNSLISRGIQVRPIWNPNHMQKPFHGNRAYEIEQATYWYERVLSLPSSVSLTDQEVQTVCKVIKELADG